jgi:hypothetical protein
VDAARQCEGLQRGVDEPGETRRGLEQIRSRAGVALGRAGEERGDCDSLLCCGCAIRTL